MGDIITKPLKQAFEIMPRIVAITTSRADYSHLYWPLRRLQENTAVDLHVIATAAHAASGFGQTAQVVRDDGFQLEVIESLLDSDTGVGAAKTIGLNTLALADALHRLQPDLLLLIADRYEMLAPASVALALRIPMAHIEGGDISEGAIDNAVRNALTKLAHVHFTPTREAARRVVAMGEEPWRVHHSGAPSLDHLRHSAIASEGEINARLGLAANEPVTVVAHHPLTLADDTRETTQELEALLAALQDWPQQLVFCHPNADMGGRAMRQRIEAFCRQRGSAQIVTNLPAPVYFGLLQRASLMVGNSSSGIMETPSVGLPCVNVGDRQRGRLQAANTRQAAATASAIREQMQLAQTVEFVRACQGMENPYGDGQAAERIAAVLADLPDRFALLNKKEWL
jgi:UDP-N-acetylglucosamine 2-epimerase (non-hydrolysing)/GDP/UDP-N,N'-diacetylbacillosamine 2-epimerase (hydrolysing)